MGLIFAGIGITLLLFLWGAPFGEFGSPPLFFRVFASFIALTFVIVGGAGFLGSIMGIKSGSNILPSIREDSAPKESSSE